MEEINHSLQPLLVWLWLFYYFWVLCNWPSHLELPSVL